MIRFIKDEIVFTIATMLAIVSMFFVTPSAEYFSYIDFRVLAILFCLMLVVAGLKYGQVFDRITVALLKKIHSVKGIEMILVLICFFSSMLITNDVALITFVPFAIMILEKADKEKDIIPIVVMQTVAANLGSMLTPIGNPQNVFLFTSFNLTLGEFVELLLPSGIVSLIMIIISVCLIGKGTVEQKSENTIFEVKIPIWKYAILFVVFVACLACVLGKLDYRIMLVVSIVGILIFKPALFRKADYMLLLTFISFFVLVGNIKNIEVIRSFISNLAQRHTFLTALGLSQVISNVPAAVLLSGFTNNAKDLILGTDVGGLGTIIASMASLISLKAYSKSGHGKTGKYMLVFTGVNLIFLAALVAVVFLSGVIL